MTGCVQMDVVDLRNEKDGPSGPGAATATKMKPTIAVDKPNGLAPIAAMSPINKRGIVPPGTSYSKRRKQSQRFTYGNQEVIMSGEDNKNSDTYNEEFSNQNYDQAEVGQDEEEEEHRASIQHLDVKSPQASTGQSGVNCPNTGDL